MKLKKIWATIILVLFCCILYAKEGYRIALCLDPAKPVSLLSADTAKNQYAILCQTNWEEVYTIDSAQINKRGMFLFSGKQNLQPGEYLLKWGSHTIDFLVSDAGYIHEKFILEGEKIIQAKGSRENAFFIRFQNLINYQWKTLSDIKQLQYKIDSTMAIVEKELPGSLFLTMLQGNSGIPSLLSKSIRDERIIHTRFGKKLIEPFFEGIEYNANDTIINILDTTLAVTADKLKPYLAAAAFDYFSHPRIMGQETIAFHIAKTYFIDGPLTPPDKEDLFEMKAFVMFNGKSLVGMAAPEMELTDTTGHQSSLHKLVKEGEYTIIYFYTDDCITCKLESPKLASFVNEYNQGVLNVYAVYTQDYEKRWKTYINQYFYIYNPFVNWINVYDPQAESGFHLLYNVISTPQLYVLDKEGIIIGRGLNVSSLEELLKSLKQQQDDLYAFFNHYFQGLGQSDSNAIHRGIDVFYEKSKDNNALFKDLFGELYTFLKQKSDINLQEGAAYLGQKYIVDKSDLWSSEYVSRIKKEVELFNMNKPGEKAADLSLVDEAGSPLLLSDIKKYKVLYFFTPDCGLCAPVTNQLKALYKSCRDTGKEIEFMAVYTGKERDKWLQYIIENKLEWINVWNGQSGADNVYDKYNLESLPSIYLLDKENRVIAREISPDALKLLLETELDIKEKK